MSKLSFPQYYDDIYHKFIAQFQSLNKSCLKQKSNQWKMMKVDLIFSNKIPALLFLSLEHHFERFALKSRKRTEHDG